MKLHPKHGLNPAIPNCFFCGKPKKHIFKEPVPVAFMEESIARRLGLHDSDVQVTDAGPQR